MPRRTEILEQAAGDRFEHVYPGATKLVTLALYADAAAQIGLSAVASILYELIDPWTDHIVWTASQGYGHARVYLGMLAAVKGEHEQADRQLEFACEFHESNGLPLWAARAHLGWAAALAGRGDVARAPELAARALQRSRQHGYGVFEERAAALVGAQSAVQT